MLGDLLNPEGTKSQQIAAAFVGFLLLGGALCLLCHQVYKLDQMGKTVVRLQAELAANQKRLDVSERTWKELADAHLSQVERVTQVEDVLRIGGRNAQRTSKAVSRLTESVGSLSGRQDELLTGLNRVKQNVSALDLRQQNVEISIGMPGSAREDAVIRR